MATGKGAFLEIDGVDLSDHALSVDSAFTQDNVETTVLSSQFRRREPTYAEHNLTALLLWSPTVQDFIDAHSPQSETPADYLALPYTYGPAGSATGATRFYGTVNVIEAQDIPPANPGTRTEVRMVFNIVSKTRGTFPAP